MNAAFHQVIGAKDDARLELFLATACRLGTAVPPGSQHPYGASSREGGA